MMKTKILFFAFALFSHFSQAQWFHNANYLVTRDSVGIGTSKPMTLLDVRGFLSVGNQGDNSNIFLNAANDKSVILGAQDDGAAGFFVHTGGAYRFVVTEAGDVGIGLTAPKSKLHVKGDLRLQSANNNTFRIGVDDGGDLNFIRDGNIVSMQIGDASGNVLIQDKDEKATITLSPSDAANQIGGEIRLKAGADLKTTIEIDGNWNGSGKGRIRTDELEIEGGADISEKFDVHSTEAIGAPKAGMLVSIDDLDAGKLKVTRQAYDKKVVGIISGANGVNTGLYMGQKGSEADGRHPVALVGRVYVLADAAYGKIEAGDLITSSPVPGYAMKVKSHKKAKGAIVGKAMSSLEKGQGYVLVLVNLQ